MTLSLIFAPDAISEAGQMQATNVLDSAYAIGRRQIRTSLESDSANDAAAASAIITIDLNEDAA